MRSAPSRLIARSSPSCPAARAILQAVVSGSQLWWTPASGLRPGWPRRLVAGLKLGLGCLVVVADLGVGRLMVVALSFPRSLLLHLAFPRTLPRSASSSPGLSSFLALSGAGASGASRLLSRGWSLARLKKNFWCRLHVRTLQRWYSMWCLLCLSSFSAPFSSLRFFRQRAFDVYFHRSFDRVV